MAPLEKQPTFQEKSSEDNKFFSRELLSKTVVSKTGKIFGEVGDLVFEVRTGELIHIVLDNPTAYAAKLELEKDKQGRILIPYNSVIASGDFLVIAEEDII
jgi:sporulation protein YlmC with PRC-barrel domain